jgi:predicted AlkP superfamily pyrophosphatase or phosphodiesterase
MTGTLPRDHGIVANGWLFRDLMEIWLWRQSNRLVNGDKIWDIAKRRDPGFTSANLFWWYNMAAGNDVGVTPRPIYKSDGRKLPDCYTRPSELREELTGNLGEFPLFNFWGPATSITASQWIVDAAVHVRKTRSPILTLVYVPHLDYDLQRLGPDHPEIAISLAAVDEAVGKLLSDANRDGARVIVLSEYGITPVRMPIHINRALREAGLLAVRVEDGGEILDVPQSRAFAVADHQIAHIYVQEISLIAEARRIVAGLTGVERVLDRTEQRAIGLDHPRSGELVAIANSDAWFTYYYWLDDNRAPDFARLVEIHRNPKPAVGWRLLKRTLGFRTLMNVVPLDASLVKGSHGRPTAVSDDGPLLISNTPGLVADEPVAATAVKDLILAHVFD